MKMGISFLQALNSLGQAALGDLCTSGKLSHKWPTTDNKQGFAAAWRHREDQTKNKLQKCILGIF